jgi:hypothetical protein
MEGIHVGVGHRPAGGVVVLIERAADSRPVRVVVAAMSLTITSWLSSGLPRQF